MVTKKRVKGRDLDDVDTGGGRDPSPRDIVDVFSFGNKFTTVRLKIPLVSYGTHSIRTKKKAGGFTNFTRTCLAWDVESAALDRTTKKCPWCKHMEKYSSKEAKDEKSVKFSQEHYANGLFRSLLANKPEGVQSPQDVDMTEEEQESGFKDKHSDTYTPFKVVRLTKTMIDALKEMREGNLVEDENGNTIQKSVMDPRYGRDVRIKFDNTKPPPIMYSIMMADKVTPLKKSEKYLEWDIFDLRPAPSLASEEAEYARWAERNGFKAAKKKDDDLDEDDDDADLDDDDDDEDDRPKRKSEKKGGSGKKGSSSKKPRDDDEDEDDLGGEDDDDLGGEDDDDLDDDDDDDPPPRKGGKNSSAKGKSNKKPARDDDDDDDDSLEDDDEDDEPPRKPAKKVASSKKGSTSKKSRRDDDDLDDDDDDDDDEDGDDSPPPRKGSKGSKSRRDEEDDDLDEDDDPPPRKSSEASKGGSSSKSSSKSKKKDLDFDDLDDL